MDYKKVIEWFNYRADGKLIWKKDRSSNAQKGMAAGSMDHGNPIIVLDGSRMLESKVIYLWHNGKLPKSLLYHINGDKTDNRIENLREGSQSVKNEFKNLYEELHKLFTYREDGNLLWNIKKSGVKNKVAGCKHREGYIVVTIDRKQYPLHRLIWCYHHGYMPEKGLYIDHVNGFRDDNRIENLRVVSNRCNQRNVKNWKTNTSGVKGVTKGNYKRWRASIRKDKLYQLGEFDNLDEAVLHRYAAEIYFNWNECEEYSLAYNYIKNNELELKDYHCKRVSEVIERRD